MAPVKSHISAERVALVQWIARVGAVTPDALAEREGCSVSAARGRLLAAERAGLLLRQRPLADRPALFTPTRAALEAAGVGRIETTRISPANARHAIECAIVAVGLERAYPDHRLTGERELRAAERDAGAPLASAQLRGGHGRRLLHRPDLVLWPADRRCGLPVAVEVELTVKAPERLLEICRAWGRCRCVAGVLYIASEQVSRPLERAILKAGASRRILVVALDAFAARADA